MLLLESKFLAHIYSLSALAEVGSLIVKDAFRVMYRYGASHHATPCLRISGLATSADVWQPHTEEQKISITIMHLNLLKVLFRTLLTLIE